MKIFIRQNDTILIENDTVYITADGHSYVFSVSDIDCVKMMTRKIVDDSNDLSAVVIIGENSFEVTGESKCFDDFFYCQLHTELSIDEPMFLKALAVTDSDECFIVYKKKA